MQSSLTPTKRKKLTLVILFIAFVWLFHNSIIYTTLNNVIIDAFLPSIPASSEIIIVNTSYTDLKNGKAGLEDDTYTEFITKISSYGPKVVGINFDRADANVLDNKFQQAAKESLDNGVPIIFGSQDSDSVYISNGNNFVHASEVPTGDTGLFHLVNDAARKAKLLSFDQKTKTCNKSFSFAILSTYFSEDNSTTCSNLIQMNGQLIPLTNDGSLQINYASGDSFRSVSIDEVLNGSAQSYIFKDKIVLVSDSASDINSLTVNPKSHKIISPIEVHANIINTIIQGKFLRFFPTWVDALLLIGIGVLVFYIFETKRLSASSILLIILSIGYFGTFLLFLNQGYVFNISAHISVVTLILIFLFIVRYYETLLESVKVKEFFQRYVSSNVLNDVLDDNLETLHIGGQKAIMSVLFADIRGFTSLSEQMPAEKFVTILNQYLTEMSDVIHSNGGTIDKYIGDCIMALWGVPLGNSDHAYSAVACAIGMVQRLKKFNMSFKGRMQGFKVGIGINSGEMTIGNMGSEDRFQYTVIGDNVNLAARIEGLTKLYDTSVIISENTYKALKREKRIYEPLIDGKEDLISLRKFLCRKLDNVQVKGKQQSVDVYQIYSVIRKTTKAFERQLETIKIYENALEDYFQGEWSIAKRELRKIEDRDYAAQEILSRMSSLKYVPPREWAGTWELKSK